MKATKQQKILGAVVILGLAAVIGDRLFIFSDSDAQSPADATQEYAATTSTNKTAVHTAPTTAPASLAQRLRDAGSEFPAEPERDAFALGAAWPTEAKAAEAAAPDTSGEQFRQSHRLTGVLTSSGRSHAMIDGKIVAVGQALDGFKLVSIEHRAATFESDNARVVLNMTERTTAVAGVAP